MGRQRALHTETHPCAPLEGIYFRLCVKKRRQSGITGNHLSRTDVNLERRSAQARALEENREYILPGQFNKLGIVSDEDVFYLYANDVFVWVVRDAELKKGIPGIVSMGTGEYLFDNFSMYEVDG